MGSRVCLLSVCVLGGQSNLNKVMGDVAASLNADDASSGTPSGYITATLLVAGTEYNLEYPVCFPCPAHARRSVGWLFSLITDLPTPHTFL